MPSVEFSTDARRCPVCGQRAFEPRVVDEQFEFRSDEGLIQVEAHEVPVEVCRACGESLSGPEAARIRHRAICRALGLLTPEEILAIREKLGLTQAEFARLTAFGEATISRWERGRLLQNRANDRYLRLVASDPRAVHFLESLSANMSVPVVSSPIHRP
jgi:HTH-type transcriptional regulator/antitoxin MqsA